jgi:hypothetical protein
MRPVLSPARVPSLVEVVGLAGRPDRAGVKNVRLP